MNYTLVQLTLRRWAEILHSSRFYAMIGAFVAVGAIFGPFDVSLDLSLWERFIHSLKINIVCWSIGVLIVVPVRLSLQYMGVPVLISILLGALLAVIATLPFLLNLLVYTVPEDFSIIYVVELALSVWMMVALISYMLVHRSDNRIARLRETALLVPPASCSPKDGDRCVLQQRMPREKRGVLYAIVAQDHYVELITDKGSELILMRLADAVQQCGQEYGLRIHRSAWISAFGVDELRKDGRRTFVKLKNDRLLPVSRSSEAKLREFISGDAFEGDALPA